MEKQFPRFIIPTKIFTQIAFLFFNKKAIFLLLGFWFLVLGFLFLVCYCLPFDIKIDSEANLNQT
jgi:hypothetical protein